MGRSSQEQAQKNRQKIVECASRLFREFGVDNVLVADVMSAADMTIGGFYKHFESKDALVEEVFSLTFEQSSAA
jgi:TetR/AcrR family transcriptional repressor of nem operon